MVEPKDQGSFRGKMMTGAGEELKGLFVPPRVIRVKRPAGATDEAAFPRVIYDETPDRPSYFYQLVGSRGELEGGVSESEEQPLRPMQAVGPLLEVASKKRKVELVVEEPHMNDMLLGERPGYLRDFALYIIREPQAIDKTLIEEADAVGIVRLDEIVFLDNSDDESEQWEDDEDSNAEDYYANDYPDEEEEEDEENKHNVPDGDYTASDEENLASHFAGLDFNDLYDGDDDDDDYEDEGYFDSDGYFRYYGPENDSDDDDDDYYDEEDEGEDEGEEEEDNGRDEEEQEDGNEHVDSPPFNAQALLESINKILGKKGRNPPPEAEEVAE